MAVILGGNDTLPQITLTQSQTFVPPQDGNVCIHVIAGGGAGYAGDTNLSGGAGGYSKKTTLAVTTAGSFTVVVGVGGVGNRNGATPAAGGNSTVAGTGLSATITANGGAGATANFNGGGGSASNGDVNNSGGGGQPAGGGAVGVYGTGNTGVASVRGGQSDASGGGLPMSGFGHIVGGNAGRFNQLNGVGTGSPPDAGDLSGGGAVVFQGNVALSRGGNGGIGGGGGGARATSGNAYAIGGAGGDGLVLIQYLPS